MLLPYCLDRRYPTDTLFLLSEGDFRFYRRHLFGSMGARWTHLGYESFKNALRRDTADACARDAKDEPDAVPSECEPVAALSHEASASRAPHEAEDPEVIHLEDAPSSAMDQRERLRATGALPKNGRLQPPPPPPKSWIQSASSETHIAGCRAKAAPSRNVPKCESHTKNDERVSDGDRFLVWERNFPHSRPSQELLDCVHIATAAHRKGVGNFIWLGWDGAKSKGRRSQPSHGLQLVAFTPAFASRFLSYLHTQEPAHLDIILRDWLVNEGGQEAVGASFIYPSCGSYETHKSGCERNLTRETGFDDPWCGEGFRCDKKGQRYLCQMQSSGGAHYLFKLDLDAPGLHWRTQRPPCKWWDARWINWLILMWWVKNLDGQYAWVGPPVRPSSPRASEAQQRGYHQRFCQPSRARLTKHGLDRKDVSAGLSSLRADPNAHRQLDSGLYCPITRLAEALVTTPYGWSTWKGEETARQNRKRRKAVGLYCRRIFVDEDEVATERAGVGVSLSDATLGTRHCSPQRAMQGRHGLAQAGGVEHGEKPGLPRRGVGDAAAIQQAVVELLFGGEMGHGAEGRRILQRLR